jgi:predicted MPP superfamily phosphohydrolase
VIGNHEIYDGLEKVIPVIEKTKAKILRNGVALFNGIQVVGVDYSERTKNFIKDLEKIKINKNKPSILLYHAPEDISIIEKKGIDLHLAGHTHGGQIFPFNLLVKLFFRNVRGLKKLNNTYQYTSMGTNIWGPPMRLGSRNEITVVDLIKA